MNTVVIERDSGQKDGRLPAADAPVTALSPSGSSPSVSPAAPLQSTGAGWPEGPYRFDDISTQAQNDGLGYIYPGDGGYSPTFAHTGDRALTAAQNRALGHLFAAAPDLYEALSEAAGWFDEYADQHYAKALTAPDGGERHGREVKGEVNRERARKLRAALAKARP